MTGDLDVSFVIPTHDRVDLLSETIESVITQTVQPREIIVVDNGTGNRAASVVARFGSRVQLVKSVPNVKQTARNIGISTASSRWVATLDDDDLLEPDYLENMARPMLDGRADIIASDHRKFCGGISHRKTNFEDVPYGYWDHVPKPSGDLNWSFVGEFPLRNLLRRIPAYPSMMIVRRDFAIRIGGYDRRMLGIPAEDIEFLIRALTYGKLALVWAPLVRYRLHPGNDTASQEGQTIGRWRIFEFVRRQHPDLPAGFVEALDQDLPTRRAMIYRLAFRLHRRPLMEEIEPLLQPGDWTLAMQARRFIAATPAPVFRHSQRFATRLRRLARAVNVAGA